MNKFLTTFALGLSLFLSGCGGGGPTLPTYTPPPIPITVVPPPPPPPPPVPVPVPVPTPPVPVRPGQLVLSTVFTNPLSAAGTCGGSPFGCNLPPGTQWGLQQQSDYTKLSVNAGVLTVNTPNTGMSMVSVQTLDHTKPMSVREVLRVDRLDDCNSIAYVGPVIYGGGVDDGDPTGRYRALYISCFPGDRTVKLWLYSPTWAGVMPGFSSPVSFGQHELRIDWYPGDHVDYFLDGVLVFTEDKTFGHDPLDEPHDPHPSMWFGSTISAVISYDAWGTLPTPTPIP